MVEKTPIGEMIITVIVVTLFLSLVVGFVYMNHIGPSRTRVDRFEDLLDMTTYSIHNTQIFDENMTFRKLRNSYYTLKNGPMQVTNYNVEHRTEQLLDYVCDGGVSPVN